MRQRLGFIESQLMLYDSVGARDTAQAAGYKASRIFGPQGYGASRDQIECRCNRVFLRRVNRAYNCHMVSASQSEAATGAMGEELELDEAAASEYIFLRTGSVLVSPSAWLSLSQSL